MIISMSFFFPQVGFEMISLSSLCRSGILAKISHNVPSMVTKKESNLLVIFLGTNRTIQLI